MTPQFALILSFEGIHLLQRAPHGWGSVGSVPLHSETLPDALAALRISAQKRTGGKGRLPVKLILPNEQIRYLVLPATQSTETAVRTALSDATPYAINELRYDFETDAAGTHVAAVALETLEEAESFAREHGFMPLGFAAVPPADSFEREVYFGVTREGQAAWLDAAADDLPVRETGPLPEEPPEDPAPEPEPATAPEAAPATANPPEVASDPQQPPASKAGEAEHTAEKRPDAAAEALSAPQPRRITPVPADKTPAAGPAAQAPTAAADPTSPVPPQAIAQATSQAEEEQKAPPMLFASRTRPKHVPVTSPGRVPPARVPPRVTGTDTDGQPLFAHRPRGGSIRSSMAASRPAQDPPTPAKRTESAAAPAGPATPDRKKPSEPETAPANNLVIGPPPKRPGLAPPAALAGFLAPESVSQPPADRPARSRRGSAIVPLALIALLVLTLTLGALFWTSGDDSQSVTTLADLPRDEATAPSEDNTIAPPPPDTTVAPPQEDDSTDASDADSTAPVIAPAPAPAVGTPRILTREQAERSYAATGVWQKAPTRPRPSANTDTAPEAQAEQSAGVRIPRDAPVQHSAPASISVTPPAQPAPPPPPDARYTLDENGFILATPEGTRTPSGVIVYASAPPVAPPVRPGTTPPAQTAPPPAPQPPADAATGGETDAPQDTAPQDTALPLNAAGIDLGASRPRPRPTGLAPAAAPASAPDPDPAPERDPASPAEPVGEAPPAAGTEVQRGFDGPAPKPRPARPEASQESPDETQAALPADEANASAQAFASASQLAVSSSLRPAATRPSGFSATVSQARAARAAAPAQPVAATVRTVRPAAPSGATASANATQSNVLNLRQVALIGVYGSARDRRAHVRLSNGRIVTVRAGERLDGGRVAAIGTSELVYTKNGRNIRLDMPGN